MVLVVGGVFVLLAIYHLRRFLLVSKETEQLRPSTQVPPALVSPRSVSFLVAGWNAASELEPFVNEFRSLPIRDKQLLLCVGGKDGTYDKARTFASECVVVLEQRPGMGKQKALREALPYATGEWIYLTDIDSRLSTECVTRMMMALATERAECVTGGMAPLPEQEQDRFVRAQWAIDRYGSLRTSELTSGILGANTLLTRNALRNAGDFEQDAPSGTDYTLAKELVAAGHNILHVKDAEVRTDFSLLISHYAKRRARWLRNVLILGRKYGCYAEVRSVIVTVGLSFLYPVLLILGFMWWWLWAALLALATHSLLNRLRYCKASQVEAGFRGVWKTFVGDAMAGILAGYETARGKVRW